MKATRCLMGLMVLLGAVVYVVRAQDRIKMCGRELIRLAVSYCGNSRLRRSLPDAEPGHHQYTWDQDHEEHRASRRGHPQFDGGKDASLAPHLFPLSFRIRRAAGKLSDICCEKGCSMKELIQFC